MTRASIATALALCLCLGCSGAPDSDQAAAEASTEQSRRAADSAVAESGLPGATGVRGAMKAADSAAVRNARLDSIAAQAER